MRRRRPSSRASGARHEFVSRTAEADEGLRKTRLLGLGPSDLLQREITRVGRHVKDALNVSGAA